MGQDMAILTSKIIGTAVLLFFVFVSGRWLSNLGRPISVVSLTIHKLIALGTLIFIGVTVYRLSQTTLLSTGVIAATVLTGVLFVATIIAGGLRSLAKPVPAMSIGHKVGSFLTMATATATMILLENLQQ
jgi:hypothetical protein